VSLFLGLTIGLIGIDPLTGTPRFTFGIPQLLDGVDVVILAAGLFAVGETLHLAASRHRGEEERTAVTGRIGMTRGDWARSWKPWLRGTLLGFPLGALPAGGAELPTFLSYGLEKSLSKHKDEFGHGAIEGVAGPEAANNAAFSGVLVPLMTLGIPTSATAAILLSALEMFQIQPGPLLFEKQAALVWGVIGSLYVGNVMLLVLNLPLIRVWIRLLDVPRPLLYAGILVFATLGVYSVSNDPVDLILLYAIGVLGLLMRRYEIPLAPLIIAAIMAPMAETHLRRALAISQGSALVLIGRPFSAIFLGLAAVLICLPSLLRRRWIGRSGDASGKA
jgi:putative tricarboxylic transport membrane protein